jgi:hypothetical protein
MQTGKTCWGIEQIGGREKQSATDYRREREGALAENRNGMGQNGH